MNTLLFAIGCTVGAGLGAVGVLIWILPQLNQLTEELAAERKKSDFLDWSRNDNRLAECQLWERRQRIS
jgi:hypothetical protein